jgi:hypothetical protein
MIVPVRHGRALLEAASAPKEGWFAPDGGHQNLAQFGALDVAIAFIKRRVCCTEPELVAAAGNFVD